ncbi:MAG: hypothetical protein IPG40_13110 [Zoogloea sp.]|nr:hypothetical protein [Zoogloea sp.]
MTPTPSRSLDVEDLVEAIHAATDIAALAQAAHQERSGGATGRRRNRRPRPRVDRHP